MNCLSPMDISCFMSMDAVLFVVNGSIWKIRNFKTCFRESAFLVHQRRCSDSGQCILLECISSTLPTVRETEKNRTNTRAMFLYKNIKKIIHTYILFSTNVYIDRLNVFDFCLQYVCVSRIFKYLVSSDLRKIRIWIVNKYTHGREKCLEKNNN